MVVLHLADVSDALVPLLETGDQSSALSRGRPGRHRTALGHPDERAPPPPHPLTDRPPRRVPTRHRRVSGGQRATDLLRAEQHPDHQLVWSHRDAPPRVAGTTPASQRK